MSTPLYSNSAIDLKIIDSTEAMLDLLQKGDESEDDDEENVATESSTIITMPSASTPAAAVVKELDMSKYGESKCVQVEGELPVDYLLEHVELTKKYQISIERIDQQVLELGPFAKDIQYDRCEKIQLDWHTPMEPFKKERRKGAYSPGRGSRRSRTSTDGPSPLAMVVPSPEMRPVRDTSRRGRGKRQRAGIVHKDMLVLESPPSWNPVCLGQMAALGPMAPFPPVPMTLGESTHSESVQGTVRGEPIQPATSLNHDNSAVEAMLALSSGKSVAVANSRKSSLSVPSTPPQLMDSLGGPAPPYIHHLAKPSCSGSSVPPGDGKVQKQHSSEFVLGYPPISSSSLVSEVYRAAGEGGKLVEEQTTTQPQALPLVDVEASLGKEAILAHIQPQALLPPHQQPAKPGGSHSVAMVASPVMTPPPMPILSKLPDPGQARHRRTSSSSSGQRSNFSLPLDESSSRLVVTCNHFSPSPVARLQPSGLVAPPRASPTPPPLNYGQVGSISNTVDTKFGAANPFWPVPPSQQQQQQQLLQKQQQQEGEPAITSLPATSVGAVSFPFPFMGPSNWTAAAAAPYRTAPFLAIPSYPRTSMTSALDLSTRYPYYPLFQSRFPFAATTSPAAASLKSPYPGSPSTPIMSLASPLSTSTVSIGNISAVATNPAQLSAFKSLHSPLTRSLTPPTLHPLSSREDKSAGDGPTSGLANPWMSSLLSAQYPAAIFGGSPFALAAAASQNTLLAPNLIGKQQMDSTRPPEHLRSTDSPGRHGSGHRKHPSGTPPQDLVTVPAQQMNSSDDVEPEKWKQHQQMLMQQHAQYDALNDKSLPKNSQIHIVPPSNLTASSQQQPIIFGSDGPLPAHLAGYYGMPMMTPTAARLDDAAHQKIGGRPSGSRVDSRTTPDKHPKLKMHNMNNEDFQVQDKSGDRRRRRKWGTNQKDAQPGRNSHHLPIVLSSSPMEVQRCGLGPLEKRIAHKLVESESNTYIDITGDGSPSIPTTSQQHPMVASVSSALVPHAAGAASEARVASPISLSSANTLLMLSQETAVAQISTTVPSYHFPGGDCSEENYNYDDEESSEGTVSASPSPLASPTLSPHQMPTMDEDAVATSLLQLSAAMKNSFKRPEVSTSDVVDGSALNHASDARLPSTIVVRGRETRSSSLSAAETMLLIAQGDDTADDGTEVDKSSSGSSTISDDEVENHTLGEGGSGVVADNGDSEVFVIESSETSPISQVDSEVVGEETPAVGILNRHTATIMCPSQPTTIALPLQMVVVSGLEQEETPPFCLSPLRYPEDGPEEDNDERSPIQLSSPVVSREVEIDYKVYPSSVPQQFVTSVMNDSATDTSQTAPLPFTVGVSTSTPVFSVSPAITTTMTTGYPISSQTHSTEIADLPAVINFPGDSSSSRSLVIDETTVSACSSVTSTGADRVSRGSLGNESRGGFSALGTVDKEDMIEIGHILPEYDEFSPASDIFDIQAGTEENTKNNDQEVTDPTANSSSFPIPEAFDSQQVEMSDGECLDSDEHGAIVTGADCSVANTESLTILVTASHHAPAPSVLVSMAPQSSALSTSHPLKKRSPSPRAESQSPSLMAESQGSKKSGATVTNSTMSKQTPPPAKIPKEDGWNDSREKSNKDLMHRLKSPSVKAVKINKLGSKLVKHISNSVSAAAKSAAAPQRERLLVNDKKSNEHQEHQFDRHPFHTSDKSGSDHLSGRKSPVVDFKQFHSRSSSVHEDSRSEHRHVRRDENRARLVDGSLVSSGKRSVCSSPTPSNNSSLKDTLSGDESPLPPSYSHHRDKSLSSSKHLSRDQSVKKKRHSHCVGSPERQSSSHHHHYPSKRPPVPPPPSSSFSSTPASSSLTGRGHRMKSKSKSPHPLLPGSDQYPRSHSSTPVDMCAPSSHEVSLLLSAASRSDKFKSHHRRAYDESPSMGWPLPNHHSHQKHRGYDNVSDEDVNPVMRDRELYLEQWSADRRSRKRYASEDDEDDHESSEERHKAKRMKHKHRHKSKRHHWRDGEPRDYSQSTSSSFNHDGKHRHGHKSQIFP